MAINLVPLLQIAGVLHFGLMAAGLAMPKVVRMKSHLAALPRFHRQLFWCYYAFIGLSLASFSLITILFAETLASGSALARVICAFLAAFWTLRLIAQALFDLSPYLTSTARRVGYHALNAVFIYLPVVYALAAGQPPWLK